MTEKEKRLQRARTEDAVFNRMLIWLAAAVIAEAVVLFVKRFFTFFKKFLSKFYWFLLLF